MTEDDLEITSEMVEAGVKAFNRYSREDRPEQIVWAVYLAMIDRRPSKRPNP